MLDILRTPESVDFRLRGGESCLGGSEAQPVCVGTHHDSATLGVVFCSKVPALLRLAVITYSSMGRQVMDFSSI